MSEGHNVQYQAPDKKIFDTDLIWNALIITLCMLDKFSYFCHLYHVQFNIKTILETSQVRPFGHVWSGFKLLQARNLFVSLSGQTDLLKLYARVIGSSRQS